MFFLNSVRVAPGVRSALAVACGLALSGWAVAQDVDEVEPIVITASRMPQLLQTAPIGASVITSEQIRRSGVSDANEAIRKLGGVASKPDLNNGRENKLDLRGFGEVATQNLVVLIDGIRISENELATARLTSIPLEMIDRIEIVRGGASVLWGEGASAGAINVVTKRPKGDYSLGKISAAAESFGGRELNASGQWGLGTATLDASAKRLRSAGFRDNSAYAQDVLTVGAQWADHGWQAGARVISEDQDSGMPGPVAYSDFLRNHRVASSLDAYASSKETKYLANLAYKQGAWAVQLDTAYKSRDTASYWGGGGSVSNANRVQQQVTPNLVYSDSLNGVDFKALIGLDWQAWSFSKLGSQGMETGEQSNQSVFGQLELNLPSQTRLSAGWREEQVRKQSVFPGDGGYAPVNYDRRDKLHAGELGVSQSIGLGWDVYGRLASSYRLANIDENRVTPSNGPLLPQENSDKELGLKWREGANALTVRYFAQNTTHEIMYISPLAANANTDPTRRRGVELEGQWSPVNGLGLSATWQQLTARYRSGPNAGQDVVLVAPHVATARASYRLDTHQTVDFGVQFQAAMATSDYMANMCPKGVPSSTLWDARYAWSDRVWTVALSGANLADKKGYDYDYSCDASYVYPYAGRSLKLTISRQF